MKATPGYARERQLQMLGEHDTFYRLGDVSCPTLVLTGKEDLVVSPENARVLAKRLPDAQLIEYPNAGHLAYVECLEQVVSDVKQLVL